LELLPAVVRSPKPMILPPELVVVRNHASAVNADGAISAAVVVPGTVPPANVVAVSVSPTTAPAVPREAWAESVRCDVERTLRAVVPEASPSRQ
jgi:hypothetical protein